MLSFDDFGSVDTIDAVDARALEPRLVDFCSGGPRSDGPGISRAKDWIAREGERMGLDLSNQEVPAGRDAAGGERRWNVLMRKKGADPSKKRVVSAHYDTVPGTVGANDNATGVIALLCLAERLARLPSSHDLEFVAFVNEEPPHLLTDSMGSKTYFDAESSRDGCRSIVQLINLDCLGCYSDDAFDPDLDGLDGDLLGAPRSGKNDFLALSMREDDAVSRAMLDSWSADIEVFACVNELVGGMSDQRWFMGVVPAVHVSDMTITRCSTYHTPRDTPDTVDFSRMAAAIEGVFRYLARVEAVPRR